MLSRLRFVRLFLVVVLVGVLVVFGAIGALLLRRRSASRVPAPGSTPYADVVSAFTVGVTALQTGPPDVAETHLKTATQLAPGEPAAWANLGLFYLRQNRPEPAADALERARTLAPDSAAIAALLGGLARQQQRFPDALAHLRRAADLAPQNLRIRYALAQTLLEQAAPNADKEAGQQIAAILDAQPGNLVALLEAARLAAKANDATALRERVDTLAARSADWPPAALEQLASLRRAAAGGDPRRAVTDIQRLRNVLQPVPAFRNSLLALDASAGDNTAIGEPLERFLVLTPPRATPAPPDTGLSFTQEAIGKGPASPPPTALRVVYLDGDGTPVVFAGDKSSVRRVDKAGGAALPSPGAIGPDGLRALDANADFRNDLVLAGASGFRLLQSSKTGGFTDVTARTGLPAAVTAGRYTGAWAADIEADGDLDIVLGTPAGPPLVLRNNGDGTFTTLRPFAGVSGLRGFAWADVDDDGDPDAALVDGQDRLRVFFNERSGQFRADTAASPPIVRGGALTVADVSGDGVLDFVALAADGNLVRVGEQADGSGLENTVVAKAPNVPGDAPRLFAADLDNNGAIDLIVAGKGESALLLGGADGGFAGAPITVAAGVADVADLNGDGRLDLIGLASSGQPVRLLGRGTKNYHWQVVRPRAQEGAGDGRINPFGVGGEVAVRAGLLFQKQPIPGPVLHFGLGDNARADVVRIVWPNGTVNALFSQNADQTVTAQQSLKGSCPFLFAWNGREMAFVTDCIWRSPLGLRINAQDTAGVAQTEDWVKIRGDQLAPRGGVYDLRVTAELWETHFFDHLGLMAVDHPAGTEIWVDERLAFPQPPLAVYATGPTRPFAQVRDDRGGDVRDLVRERDGSYLDTFGRGRYQGVTRDHWVEMALPGDAPASGPLYLIAHGWIHPTDSSINVALGQGKHAPPQGLTLETPDGHGGWTAAQSGLGFPTGKVKTIVIRLDGGVKNECRFRLRTNLEIYWDQLAWAAGKPDATLRRQRVDLASAQLRYRGFSVVAARDASSPELPQSYYRLATTGQPWRDLIGFYTRWGDVRELLMRTDDRYVIMNAGDEMALRFPALAPPAPGWTRDFVLIGDGWVKDGDFNTAFSKTVLPLPAHNRPDYTTPPGRLENDPVFRRHADDWTRFHTRWVAPDGFQSVLRPAL